LVVAAARDRAGENIKHCVEHKHKDRVWYTRAGDIAKYCFSLPKGLIPGS
jgi:allantoinase